MALPSHSAATGATLDSAGRAAAENDALYADMAANHHAVPLTPGTPDRSTTTGLESPVHPRSLHYMEQGENGAMYRVYVPSTPPLDQVLGSTVPSGHTGSETPTSSHWGGTEYTGADLPLSENARSLHQRTESFRSERSQSLFSETSVSSMENVMVTGSHSKRQLGLGDSSSKRPEGASRKYTRDDLKLACAICDEPVGLDLDGNEFVPCECAFPVCRPCYEYIRKNEGNRCPRCKEQYKRKTGSPPVEGDPIEEGARHEEEEDAFERVHAAVKKEPLRLSRTSDTPRLSIEGPPAKPSPMHRYYDNHDKTLVAVPNLMDADGLGELLDPSKPKEAYGYGSILWAENAHQPSEAESGDGSSGGSSPPKSEGSAAIKADNSRMPLSRKVPITAIMLNPYRLMVVVRLVVLVLFLSWRISNPNYAAYGLWLVSVICETWFGVSWILDQVPKWSPITRETYLDRLNSRYDKSPEDCELAALDIFVSTADPEKEPPLTTSNVVLSVLAADYPYDKVACYLSDDGAALLTFEALTETASFARFWVPFCKKFEIEPRAPEVYFQQRKEEYLKDKTHADFVRERRQMKREYEEFKVRINALVAKAQTKPRDGWKMADGTPWPGNLRSDHVGMIQVFLQPDGDTMDIEGNPLPRLVYVSREKRPGYDHNKKAGAMNALIRASALITNAPYILNLDCDHYVNNCQAFREAMCFMMDPVKGARVCYVQFPQRFDGVDRNDRYANHNTVFYEVNMKGLDGIQGPMYVGTGCCFRRQALYGTFAPSKKGGDKAGKVDKTGCGLLTWCCGEKRARGPGKGAKGHKKKDSSQSLVDVADAEELQLMPMKWHARRFGVCHNFVMTTTELDGGCPTMSPRTVLSDVILVISCGYEDNTEWGKEIGWIYGSITEDIVTGMVMHTRGWRSIYCSPPRPAFKGTAPINLTDRLHQVLRWGLGSVEIFFSPHNPLWAGWGQGLKFLQRFAYVNTTVYPFTSIALTAYCVLPAVCLLLNQFIIPVLDNTAIIYFLVYFIAVFGTAILEIRWSGVALDEYWRNEQFWVIGGTSAHLVAVWQGLLKITAGFESQFTLTQKDSNDDGEFAELYIFRWTPLIIPPTTIIIVNLMGIIAGISRQAQKNRSDWGQLFGKCFFAVWVLLHLYPFAKGLMGRHNRTPTIVIVWSTLLAISLSLLMVTVLG